MQGSIQQCGPNSWRIRVHVGRDELGKKRSLQRGRKKSEPPLVEVLRRLLDAAAEDDLESGGNLWGYPDARSLGGLARSQLDDLLVPLGFQSGQGDSGQIIFCAPQEVLDRHFPLLGVIGEQFPAGGGGCLDLVIEGSLSGGITRVELEGHDLSGLLARVGSLDQAELSAHWPGESVGADLERIRYAMARLSGAAP